MLGALVLTLKTDKSTYQVGESPIYTLQNAQPGSIVKWTSFVDGQPTGEYEEDYGGVIGAVGGVELTGGEWTDLQKGRWQKIAVVYAPDGSKSTATTFFNVVSTAPATMPTTPAATNNWFSGDFSFQVGQETYSINRGLALIGGAFAAYLFVNYSGKKR